MKKSDTRSQVCIAMMGLPRSGKSTIVRNLRTKYGAPVVHRDSLRLALHGQRFKQEAEGFVKAIADVMLKSLFLVGHEVVIVDETNFSRSARDRLKSPDWKTVFYEVDTDPEICKKRALATGQPDLLPVIDSMMARYDPLWEDEERYNSWELEGYEVNKNDWWPDE